MEENTPNQEQPGKPLSEEETKDVGGGDGTSCPTAITVSVPGITYTASSLTQAYEDVVDATSHVIERVANAAH